MYCVAWQSVLESRCPWLFANFFGHDCTGMPYSACMSSQCCACAMRMQVAPSIACLSRCFAEQSNAGINRVLPSPFSWINRLGGRWVGARPLDRPPGAPPPSSCGSLSCCGEDNPRRPGLSAGVSRRRCWRSGVRRAWASSLRRWWSRSCLCRGWAWLSAQVTVGTCEEKEEAETKCYAFDASLLAFGCACSRMVRSRSSTCRQRGLRGRRTRWRGSCCLQSERRASIGT